ncbi:response regulator [Blastopirellula marina]|uniref:Response regulator n=1 Tax=Blastopirellula marina TaxID=124 RepID=A0A2S8EZH8_9BACT|nr:MULTISPECIES: response regulator [Pirellulaceae]PQO25308.1 response regulator [Blastopirellula marina]RCS41741.1 response regulator [Bremerella cremea]
MAPPFKVAVIDDDESVRRALQRLLQSSGYAVETFASAEEFVECDAASHTDCLLLDVHLRRVSGLQLQRMLTVANQHIPIVFITSHQDEHSRQAALQAGATDFLCKPFDTEALLEVIERAIEHME